MATVLIAFRLRWINYTQGGQRWKVDFLDPATLDVDRPQRAFVGHSFSSLAALNPAINGGKLKSSKFCWYFPPKVKESSGDSHKPAFHHPCTPLSGLFAWFLHIISPRSKVAPFHPSAHTPQSRYPGTPLSQPQSRPLYSMLADTVRVPALRLR